MELFHEQDWTLKNCTIFLDVDGTLVGEGGNKMDARAQRAFDRLKKNNVIVLCSNSPNLKRTEKMAKELKVLWNPGPHKKPSKEVLTCVKLRKKQKHVVIGNLYCIDGRFAKAIGATFHPVKTLLGQNEPWTNKLFYLVDRFLFSLWI